MKTSSLLLPLIVAAALAAGLRALDGFVERAMGWIWG